MIPTTRVSHRWRLPAGGATAVRGRRDGSSIDNVHVGVQMQRDPGQLGRADESESLWKIDVDVLWYEGVVEFRGPKVQGKRGDRFIYLTWATLTPTTGSRNSDRPSRCLIESSWGSIESAMDAGRLRAVMNLTGDDGGPGALDSTPRRRVVGCEA